MNRNPNILPAGPTISAWREILVRIFADTPTQYNVYPDWLVNPATNRRLKLDLLYPEIGVAVRFEGLQGKQRLSLEEEVQKKRRDIARVEQCRAHGIQLIQIDLLADDLKPLFREIDLMLSRAAESHPQIIKPMRSTAARLSRRISQPADLKLYAELWQDRQYQIPEPSPPSDASPITFTVGMEVEHPLFGPGVIAALTPEENDTLLTIDFVEKGRKILAASLVHNKLTPL